MYIWSKTIMYTNFYAKQQKQSILTSYNTNMILTHSWHAIKKLI